MRLARLARLRAGDGGIMREPLCWERFVDDGIGAAATGYVQVPGSGRVNARPQRAAPSGQAVTSRRVIRQAPTRSGSTIQMASEVPACAHWVALMTFSVIWPRARA